MISYLKKIVNRLGLRNFACFAITSITKHHPIKQCQRNGIHYQLDLREMIDFSIFIGGWEPGTIKFLNRCLKDADVVIEVGANIGAHTLTMSKLVGNKGHIYAFEPATYARDKLYKNIRLNPDFSHNISVYHQFVTNKNKVLPLIEIQSSWRMDEDRIAPEKVKADYITLDEFYKINRLHRVSLLKIDVDGYDYKVLQGAYELIKTFKPLILIELCQYTLAAQGDSMQLIFRYLEELGYKAYFDNGKEINSYSTVAKRVGMDSAINGVFIPA